MLSCNPHIIVQFAQRRQIEIFEAQQRNMMAQLSSQWAGWSYPRGDGLGSTTKPALSLPPHIVLVLSPSNFSFPPVQQLFFHEGKVRPLSYSLSYSQKTTWPKWDQRGSNLSFLSLTSLFPPSLLCLFSILPLPSERIYDSDSFINSLTRNPLIRLGDLRREKKNPE